MKTSGLSADFHASGPREFKLSSSFTPSFLAQEVVQSAVELWPKDDVAPPEIRAAAKPAMAANRVNLRMFI
jgi:hypothetical protein